MPAKPETANETTARRIACPRCTAPMRSLQLSSHKRAPVTVDHCPDCRLVWFDQFESVQLDGFGWVRLLREMETSAKRPLAEARIARPSCPACADPLNSVQNRSRFGLFAALECPRRHGHLHSHSGLLAERGLVRPLGGAERRALAQEKHRLHCFNCGGPASSTDNHCSYCATALVVLDLPRLAHSLRLRFDGMGASPQAMGRHTAWSCRACGGALDPGRETSCSHCGHLVVAFDLPDIEPLLEAAEAEHLAAAEVDAQRLARFPSTRRAAMPTIAPSRRVRAEPAAPTASWTRTLMLAGWLPLLALLAAAFALAAPLFGDGSLSSRTPAQALRAQPVGTDPGAAWVWVEAHRLIQPRERAELQALRRGLFDLYGRQLAGDRWPADATVGSVIDGAPALLPVLADRDALDRWQRGLARHLRPVRPDTEIPLPDGAAVTYRRLAPVALGVWLEADTRGHGVWALTVENTGPATLQLSQLSVRLPVAGADGLAWRCKPARNAGPLLRAGQRLLLVCQTAVLVRLQEDLWSAALQQLTSGEPWNLTWRDEGIRFEGAVDAAIDRLVVDAVPASAQFDKFMRRHTDLRRDTAPVTTATAAPAKTRWAPAPGSRWQELLLPGLLGAFVAYCAAARLLGERRATIALLLVAALASYLLGRGEGAASVLTIGMFFGVALILSLGFTFAFRIYRDAVFRRFG